MAKNLKKVEIESKWLLEKYKTNIVYLLSERGAFGKVYVLDDPQDKKNSRKALKLIEIPSGMKQHEWMKESIGEIKILDMLNDCPSIIKMLDYKIEENRIFLVMELAKESLNDRLVDPNTKNVEKSLNKDEILKLMKCLSESLNYAKNKFVHHRDIKPDNILIMENGDFKVSDWGGSKIVRKIGTISQTSYIGTPIYVAPEVEEGMIALKKDESEESLKEINLEKADIYSFGILLIECCGIDKMIIKKNERREGHEKGLLKTLKENVKGDFQKDLIEIIVEMCKFEAKERWGIVQFENARQKLEIKHGEDMKLNETMQKKEKKIGILLEVRKKIKKNIKK